MATLPAKVNKDAAQVNDVNKDLKTMEKLGIHVYVTP